MVRVTSSEKEASSGNGAVYVRCTVDVEAAADDADDRLVGNVIKGEGGSGAWWQLGGAISWSPPVIATALSVGEGGPVGIPQNAAGKHLRSRGTLVGTRRQSRESSAKKPVPRGTD